MSTALVDIPATTAPVQTAALAARWKKTREHVHILPAFLLCLLVCTWFVTWGDWRLFDAERFGGYYDAQARAILRGRLDVPPEAIGFEAFVRDGKSYGYFGIAPALLRIPVLLLFPTMDGHWARLAMLVACALNLLYAYRLLLLFRASDGPFTTGEKSVQSLFIVAAGIGSTNVFLLSRSYTYHEAIMWGATFALLFSYYLIRCLIAPTSSLLVLAGAACFFSFLSRPTAGAGAMLAMTYLVARVFNPCRWPLESTIFGLPRRSHGLKTRATTATFSWTHAGIGFAAIALAVCVYFGVNWLKFRTLDGVPVRYYSLYQKNPERMRLTGGKQIHLTNFRTIVLAYLGPGGVEVDRHFPWVYLSTHPRVFPEAAIDIVEPHSSIPVSMPALFLLACLGVRAAIRGQTKALRAARLPTIAMLLGGGIVLVTVGVTERYLHDLYPFLILAGAAGACHIARGAHPFQNRKRVAWAGDSLPVSNVSAAAQKSGGRTAVLAPLVLLSIALNCAFALDFQREIVWGVPQAKRDQFDRLRSSIDRVFHQPATAGRE